MGGGGGLGGNWLRPNVGNISVSNHEGEPMDFTQAHICTSVSTLQTKCKMYAGEHLNQSFSLQAESESKNVMTELSASDAAYSLRDDKRIYFNIC